MKTKWARIAGCIGLLLGLYVGTAQSIQEWATITVLDEVRTLVSGRALDGGSWLEYYRADGKMAYLYIPEDSLVVREWKISDDGGLCSSVNSCPEFIVDC